MKKSLLILSVLVLGTMIVSSSCKKSTPTQSCDGKGTFCFVNKRDSLLIINIVQVHATMDLKHDEMQCQDLSGGVTYTVKYSGPAYTGDLKDTTILVQNCDYKTIVIMPPTTK
jgi:hypothetical protein